MVSLLPVAAAAASTADCAADCCDAEPLLPYRRLLLRRPRYAQLHDFLPAAQRHGQVVLKGMEEDRQRSHLSFLAFLLI